MLAISISYLTPAFVENELNISSNIQLNNLEMIPVHVRIHNLIQMNVRQRQQIKVFTT